MVLSLICRTMVSPRSRVAGTPRVPRRPGTRVLPSGPLLASRRPPSPALLLPNHDYSRTTTGILYFSSLSDLAAPTIVRTPTVPPKKWDVSQKKQPYLKLGHDEQICADVTLRPIHEIGEKLKLDPESNLVPYGYTRAKVKIGNNAESIPRKGKLVLVTAMTPTRAGEGKTTTSVGLTDGLNRVMRQRRTKQVAAACLREPSLGPVFGMKGGGAGGGRAQVAPMDKINLHFNGDFHAISCAHNLLAALVDNHIYFKKSPELDARRVTWKRVLDMNDRALRNVVVGCGDPGNGYTRQSGFDITVASEVMAVFCLATSLSDLERRLGEMIVGHTRGTKDEPQRMVRAKEIGNAHLAMTALLKEAFLPNLVQTLEHSPALVHGGPFANIAHGCNSLVATDLALKLADYVITEAGFGADLGAEKFLNIKCPSGGLQPDLCVLVVTVRACKLHGESSADDEREQMIVGLDNVRRHCENLEKFGLKTIICINEFPDDTAEEHEVLQKHCSHFPSVVDCVVSSHFSRGGEGAERLAASVLDACESANTSNYKPLYKNTEGSLEVKIRKVATEIYRAGDVVYSAQAASKLKKFEREFPDFAVCVAKTQYSFSDEPTFLNAPVGHTFHITDMEVSAGAGFLVVKSGNIMTMPGLPKVPASESIGITAEGKISIEGSWVVQTPGVGDEEKPFKVDHDDPKIISGTRIARQIRQEIKQEVEVLGQQPGLGVIMVGDRVDSATYVFTKTKLAKECGFLVKDRLLPASATEDDVIKAVDELNNDSSIHGILTQLPMPAHIAERNVLRRILVSKDVDGFSARNIGNLALKGGDPYSAASCTPLGIMELLKRSGIEVAGKKAVVLGRSNIVGMPLTLLLHHADATVTMCHSKTQNLPGIVRNADIVCAAIGRPNYVPGSWIKPGAVVIDVGINADPRRPGALTGDVNFEEAYERASLITPVPGGVGPMTIAMLLRNTLDLCKLGTEQRQLFEQRASMEM